MNESQIEQPLNASTRLRREIGRLSARIAEFLAGALPDESAIADGRAFLLAYAQSQSTAQPLGEDVTVASGRDPLDFLCAGLNLIPLERDLVLLAGMPDEHEGFAQIFRIVHPERRPRPTAGLIGQMLSGGDNQTRDYLREELQTGAAVKSGLIRLEGDDPFFARDLRLAEEIWPALHGIDAWPTKLLPVSSPIAMDGLDSWLSGAASRALGAIAARVRCTILVTDDDAQRAFDRAAALVEHAGARGERFRLAEDANGELESLIQVHAIARDVVPIIQLRSADGPSTTRLPEFVWVNGPVVVCARQGTVELHGSRPLIGLTCDRLTPTDLIAMWRCTLPNLAEQADVLAARYPVEPAIANQVAFDAHQTCAADNRVPTLEDIGASIRTRAGALLRGGVALVRPTANWQQLVLPPESKTKLREAVDRLLHQSQVLDRWRFLEGRQGARGVRMLLAGPPGTGKTLSAEVMAHTLRVDLLVVDLSRVVSKWIGETEKNLAEVFDTAERSRAVLVFDEADALFGKRTEVSDAHDRYANLETAYLLARLERFEGLAILSTNLRQNIDPAFTRRLEFIIEYEQPDHEQRLRLWQCHVPDDDLLADDVNLSEFASHFSMVGGLIRNAAVAAAFLAAADNDETRPPQSPDQIARKHFIRAIKREYEKSGQPFPGLPAGAA